MIEFIAKIANPLKEFFYGDYWFITLPIFLAPFLVFVALEIRRVVLIVRKQKKNGKKVS